MENNNSKSNIKIPEKITLKIEYPTSVSNILDFVKDIFSGKLEVVSKSLSGLVFFLIFDFTLGKILSMFFKNIDTLLLTKSILSFYRDNLKGLGININFFLFIMYLLLWSWGKFILFLSKFWILDSIKGNYDDAINSEKEIPIKLKDLREKVLEQLKKNYDKDFLEIVNTDYMLYLFLGRNRNIFTKSIGSRNKLAEETAFYLVNLSFIFFLIVLAYILFIDNSPLLKYGITSTQFKIGLTILWFLLSFITFKFLLRKLIVKKVASIYISRNLRLYINFFN
ncbi:MAG: hypothetical protein DSY60_01740 [Persephonella sp.]|nr:MAG: hypothetical protein DSY60_01740 [Persephonella sp.]